jgi:NAD(P)-dependent dehydrogenase (short-subunit alcohol dehydrogenase family)
MNSTPILKGKQAVVFAAGGSIGTAVAKEFATEVQKSSCLVAQDLPWKH